MKTPKTILVVCTGNICRSPIAEALGRLRWPGVVVESAGTAALVGEAAHPLSIAVCRDKEISLQGHTARQILPDHVARADLILTMDQSHSEWIALRYPQYRGKILKMLHWDGDADVPDPYGQDKRSFEQTLALIQAGVESWCMRLK